MDTPTVPPAVTTSPTEPKASCTATGLTPLSRTQEMIGIPNMCPSTTDSAATARSGSPTRSGSRDRWGADIATRVYVAWPRNGGPAVARAGALRTRRDGVSGPGARRALHHGNGRSGLLRDE